MALCLWSLAVILVAVGPRSNQRATSRPVQRLAQLAEKLGLRHAIVGATRLTGPRVEWKCNALNERSREAALRLGFVFEGIFRQHMVVKGRNRDTAWYSMLDGERPAIRANFERWLSEDPPTVSLRELNTAP